MIAVRTPPRRLRATRMGLLLAIVVYALIYVGAFVARGGHFYIVETPSMGTSAPVGTLLWVEPVDTATLRPGDFVTFHRPGTNQIFSHRIEALNSDGTFSTKGEITATDPWRLEPTEIIGTVHMRWWAAGWLVRAVPILLVGFLLTMGIRSRFRRREPRTAIAVMGTALTLSIALAVLRPLTRATQLSIVADGEGGRATYVSTGLLPMKLAANGGDTVVIRAGEVGSVLATRPDHPGHYPITLDPVVPWWLWVVLIGACFVPAIWTASYRRR